MEIMKMTAWNSTGLARLTSVALVVGLVALPGPALAEGEEGGEGVSFVVETPAPSLSGDAIVGQVLSVTVPQWSPAVDSFSYVWLRNGVAIPGEVSPSYTVVAADVGQRLAVSVSGAAQGQQPVTASSTEVIVQPAPFATVADPILAGDAVVGKVLTATVPQWTPAVDSFSYVWLRNGVVIPGEVSPSYTVVAADVGQRLAVSVTGAKEGFHAVSVVSADLVGVANSAAAVHFVTPGKGRVNGRQTILNVRDKTSDPYIRVLPFVRAEIAEGTTLGSIAYSPGLPADNVRSELCVMLEGSSRGLCEVGRGSVFDWKKSNYSLRLGDRVTFQETFTRYYASFEPGRNCHRVPRGKPCGVTRWFAAKPQVYVQAHVAVVPFLTAMPVISGTAKTGESLSASYLKHETSVTTEVVEWHIIRPEFDFRGVRQTSGRTTVVRGPAYTLVPEDFGATVRLVVRASSAANAPTYHSSTVVTVTTDNEDILRSDSEARAERKRVQEERASVARLWSKERSTIVIHSSRNTVWQGVGRVSAGLNIVSKRNADRWLTRASYIRYATPAEVRAQFAAQCSRGAWVAVCRG